MCFATQHLLPLMQTLIPVWYLGRKLPRLLWGPRLHNKRCYRLMVSQCIWYEWGCGFSWPVFRTTLQWRLSWAAHSTGRGGDRVVNWCEDNAISLCVCYYSHLYVTQGNYLTSLLYTYPCYISFFFLVFTVNSLSLLLKGILLCVAQVSSVGAATLFGWCEVTRSRARRAFKWPQWYTRNHKHKKGGRKKCMSYTWWFLSTVTQGCRKQRGYSVAAAWLVWPWPHHFFC